MASVSIKLHLFQLKLTKWAFITTHWHKTSCSLSNQIKPIQMFSLCFNWLNIVMISFGLSSRLVFKFWQKFSTWNNLQITFSLFIVLKTFIKLVTYFCLEFEFFFFNLYNHTFMIIFNLQSPFKHKLVLHICMGHNLNRPIFKESTHL